MNLYSLTLVPSHRRIGVAPSRGEDGPLPVSGHPILSKEVGVFLISFQLFNVRRPNVYTKPKGT